MVKSKTIEYSYDFPWELVVLAYEDKFWKIPNDDLPDVLEVHFLDFDLDVANEITRFKRWGRFRMAMPNWMLKLAGGPDSIVLTSSTMIDRRNRILVATGANKTFRSRLVLDEKTTFRADPENPNRTLLTLEGTIEIKVSLMGWMISAIENAIIRQYEAMTGKGREIERKQVAALKVELEDRKEAAGMTKSERIARSLAAEAAGLPKYPAGAAGLPSLGFPLLTGLLAAMLADSTPADEDGDAADASSEASGSEGAPGASESKGGDESVSPRLGGRRRSLSGDAAMARRSRGPSLEEAMAHSEEPGALRSLGRHAIDDARGGAGGDLHSPVGSPVESPMSRSKSVGSALAKTIEA
uniref:PRELI/MSF1 domain-containing protein n=1 Tax=Bicosoecida sp. CB-2014 TaxID=1486930 RepID=A0A7S1G5V1_9STRA|mmetsp:Transcript_15446/g.53658  ORF Transcript_15446/g.53658 Transcript_15446/m.53658 type:complete len:355 (+) Transcript_15446:177-1241(+)